MIIKRFVATGLHGYLDFDLRFDPRLTFLTGINGSGKTTVINAIVSLISPILSILTEIEFKAMSVEISEDGSDVEIRAIKEKDSVFLSTSISPDVLIIPRYRAEADDLSYRTREREAEFFREFAAANANSPVLTAIGSLPTPMFLDLDRRARAAQERRDLQLAAARYPRKGRNVFSASLTQGLFDAAALAEAQYRELMSKVNRLSDDLRRDMVLNLLTLDASQTWGGPLQTPSQQDLSAISKMREYALSLPQILNVARSEIERRVNPFLDKLDNLAKAIPAKAKVEKILQKGSESKEFRAVIGWSANVSQLTKLHSIIEMVERYNSDRDQTSSVIAGYLELTNNFLSDSGKQLRFDASGALVFSIESGDEARPIYTLSSGEGQIFVILTHLFFNPSAQQANVFIVDEPELSLHVRWQELFVDSVIAANPRVQYILATHSPSVILDKLDNCRDLNRRKGSRV